MSPGRTDPSASRSALPPPAPPSRRTPPRPDPPMVCSDFSRTCLARKLVSKTIRRRHTGQRPGKKSARGPADKRRANRWSTAGRPLVDRWSTADFVPPAVYIEINLFVPPGIHPGRFSSMVWKVGGTVVSWANRPIGVPSCPSLPVPPPRRAPPRPDAPVVYPVFGRDRFDKSFSRKRPA